MLTDIFCDMGPPFWPFPFPSFRFSYYSIDLNKTLTKPARKKAGIVGEEKG
jgi:hypothetical protein